MKKIGFIGCGNIATAIIKGALSSGAIKAEDVVVFDIDASKLSAFLGMGAISASDIKDLAEKSDVLFLTVKPQVLDSVLAELKPALKKETVIISPVAGAKIEKINLSLGGEKKIIRVMPNTPLTVSAGATALVKGDRVTKEEFDYAKKIFDSCSVTAVVEEKDIEVVTGISGSSPAFFMRFAREIINSATKQGMEKETAEKLVLATMSGTAKLVEQSKSSIDDLIKAVASPGGTTEAGLKEMDNQNFDQTVNKIISAAVKRAEEL